ncbi:MAG: hypothetical protein ABSH17_08985 [Syntrophobacteraceae bacterium]
MAYLSSTAAAMTAMTAMTTAVITTAIITTAAVYHDGEGEVDARRYIQVRGIYDHWRRIDVKSEGRRDGYAADR